MWENGPSSGCVAMFGAWTLGLVLISLGGLLGETTLGQFGISVSGLAAALTVMWDNARTRRMVRCAIGRRRVPSQRDGEQPTRDRDNVHEL